MSEPLPPDPYAALGVSKDADAQTIKSTYRKLVLKCHPDKVTDESLKQQKQEEFHKIQQAYELIGDENKRATYDAEVRLAELRKEKLSRAGSGPGVEVRTAHYDIRTAAPSGATFGARGPARYEERKPSRSYDDDRYYEDRSSSRKHDGYDTYPKRSSATRSSRPEKEPIKVTTRVASDRTRSDAKKSKDKEERRDRSQRFVYIDDDSDSDEKARYEAEYKRRTDEARRQQQEAAEKEEARRAAAEARRKADEARRSFEDQIPRRHGRSEDRDRDEYDGADYRQRKLSDLENGVKHYIRHAKASTDQDARPSPGRTSSSRDARPDYYDVRSAKRPEVVRRSSARPSERESSRPISSGRDNRRDRKNTFPEIVEWDSDMSPPPFKHSTSSPAEIKTVPRAPGRSFTESSYDTRETSPPIPMFRRSETMPSVHTTSSSKKEAKPGRPSHLRNTESAVPHDSGYSSPGTPENTYPTVPSSTKKVYHYPTSSGGITLTPEDIAVANGNGRRTILREPERHRQRSPSPLSRPPMGANRTTSASSTPRYPPAALPPRSTPLTVPPPPIGRAATMHVSPDRRGHGDSRDRDHKLFGEMDSDYTRRPRQPSSYDPDQVSFGKKYGPEDVRWSRPRERTIPIIEKDREYSRPTLRKHETFAY